MFLRSFISKLNESFQEAIPEIKTFGLAQSIVRTVGNEDELFPGVANLNGEIEYPGIDDVEKIQIYHRNAGINTTRSNTQGVGDSANDIVNIYQMSIIGFVNTKRSKLFPEEVFLYLQSNIPDGIKADPYKFVYIRTTNVIINSQLIFRAEYSGSRFNLPAEMSLFQINYTIESRFKKDCFVKCPDNC